jgi:hypothetical protein
VADKASSRRDTVGPGEQLRAIPGGGQGSGRSSRTGPPSEAYRLPDPPPEPSEIYDPRDPDNEPVPHADHWTFEALVESDSYSKEHFYPSSSHNGETSTQLRFAVSAAVYHRIQTIIQQRRFPQITTHQDLVRDAIHHRLYDYEMMLNRPNDDPDAIETNRILHMAIMSSRLERRIQQRKEAELLHDRVKEELAVLAEVGDDRAARLLIEETLPDVPYMERPWGERLLGVLEKEAERLGIEI